ncbi:hypothetical protein [Streptomyces sp. BK239]|uniref:hypothetical protein n=1 Tax=Streptomyces sp. BK239 TaxID=2512155 RepID=UPI0010D93CA3|nr:hypothetical protein [Streptomyces sp. BK239]RZU15015.1 hypothetical protein EV567_3999 [Streptomyces sp. BK239]
MGPLVLARLPLIYLIMMATFATLLLCLAVDRWMKVRKLTLMFFALSIASCLGMIAVGKAQWQHWNAHQMLILYSFAWTGLAIGFLPYRKILLQYSEEFRNGIKREQYQYPRKYQIFTLSSVIVMCFLAFILAS